MKIAVLVSGGVDSSVALQLLKNQGHELTAFYLKIWLEDELSYLGNCPWQEDLSYVQAVCNQLNVPLSIVSLQQEYKDYVVEHTIAEVKSGRTPNPDILCNQRIKFGFFLDYINQDFDMVASGHYAQIVHTKDQSILIQSPDIIKDQTYFLSYLNQQQLKRILFPIGHLQKHEVRELAHQYNLPNKDRKDSQGICFLGKFKFSDFIQHHLGVQKGLLVEYETGKTVGQHNGYWFYTLGQRKAIGLGGGPWFVVAKNIPENIVYISHNYYTQDKKRNSFVVDNVHWLSGSDELITSCQVKIRHGAHMYTCAIKRNSNNTMSIVLNEQDQGIAPGQYAVFYDNNRCIASSIITHEQ